MAMHRVWGVKVRFREKSATVDGGDPGPLRIPNML